MDVLSLDPSSEGNNIGGGLLSPSTSTPLPMSYAKKKKEAAHLAEPEPERKKERKNNREKTAIERDVGKRADKERVTSRIIKKMRLYP